MMKSFIPRNLHYLKSSMYCIKKKITLFVEAEVQKSVAQELYKNS